MAILTISRQFGDRSKDLGTELAVRLGYTCIDRSLILADMKALGRQWEKSEEEFGDHYPGIWERYDWSFQAYVALTQSLILNYGLQNRVILLGRGSNFLFKGIPYALRIRFMTPKTVRAQNLLQQQDMTPDKAEWLIDRADHEMMRAVQLIYGKKIDDPAEYDLVFNQETYSEDELIRVVSDALLQKEKFETPEALKMLQLRAIAAKVKAGIATNPQLLIPTLEVEVISDTVVLRGVIHNPKEHQQIEEAAKKLAGDVPVKCELHYRGSRI